MRTLQTVLTFVLLTAFAVMAQVDPGTDNLTHWWSFDDGTANDQVGVAHGTVIGDALIADGSLYVETLDQWVELPGDVLMVSDYSAITIATWFTSMADSNNGYHMIVYFGDSVNGMGANGLFISPCRGDDVSRAAISCGNESAPYSVETGVNGPETNDGLLHHMVVTIDDAQVDFYVDGEWMGSAELTGDNALWNISPNYAYIGKGGYTGDPVFRSSIHDVRMYNRALGDGEVAYLYQSGPFTKVENRGSAQPQGFSLAQNYPNPFNPSTMIEYSLSNATMATLSVYNMIGEKVATLSNGLHQAGTFKVTWDGLDDFGHSVNSGLYIYKLETDNFSSSKKMLFVK
jgi:hypothetical protein